MPFQQPEYERAFQEFVSDAVEAFVVEDAILSQIHRVKVPEDPLPVQAGESEVQDPQLIGAELQVPGQQVLDGDAEALQTAIAVAAEQRIAQMKQMLYAHLAADPRNIINPEGQPLCWDLVLDNFEQREWSVDADGIVQSPSLVLRPELSAKLGEMSTEQTERRDRIRAAKQADADARRRNRRLS